MELSLFDFNLPKELIATKPCYPRDHSTLMAFGAKGDIFLKKFYNILDFLREGDLLCFNNSKVIKSKLVINYNNSPIEIYLNKHVQHNIWHGFAKPARKLQEGAILSLGNAKITILKKLEAGAIHIQFEDDLDVMKFLEQYGQMPLPPYMKRDAQVSDEVDYQTIYSQIAGSVACPTAGLHFTKELLARIEEKGVETCFVTLHVGAGTFLPIKTENILEHKMHSESFEITKDAALKINNAKKNGRRIISVGTTSLRALESAYQNGGVSAGSYDTDIFITPGFKFNVVDSMITNLHLPKSTLLLLVSAFVGREKIMKAYQYAIDNKLRFFSYGDAMILDRVDV